MIKKVKLVLAVLLINAFAFSQSNSIDEIVAIVGQKIILKSDVETQMLQYKSRGETFSGNLRCHVFEELLYQALLVNQAKVDSIEVSDIQVEGELDRRMMIFEEQMGGRAEMEDYFNKPYSEIKNYFRDIVQDQMMSQQMQSQITQDIRVTPEEVKKFYKGIPKDSLPLVESEIEIAQVVIHPKIKDKQIEKLKETLQEYIDRVNKGEDFSFLASLYSDDVASAENDGDLGWVRRGDLVSEFAAAAFELEKEGELSGIIKTEFGYHVIQFIERKGERIHIRHILKIPKPLTSEKRKAKSSLDSIADNIRNGNISFEEAALRYSTDEDSNKSGGILINPYTGTSAFESSQLDPATNYILKQMKIGEVSNPFESYSMKGKPEIKIIKLVNKTEPHIASFETDYQLISDMAKEKKKEEIVSKWIQKSQKSTYFMIDVEYHDCKFKYKGWLSVQ
ncbi:MAG: peptidylprolyl isomerase [Bacteroidales bacterium]|nr:peptidylprolyl isomerase [Bacteroidales bacterium]